MRLLSIVCFCLIAFSSLSGECNAQLSLSQGSICEQNGIVTSGSQVINAPAKKLRFFISFKAIDTDPPAAIAKLKTDKAAIIAALGKAGATEGSVKFSATRIREWEREEPGSFGSGSVGLAPTVSGQDFTATTRASFDVTLEGLSPDEFPTKLHEVFQLLPKPDFDSPKITVMYVGEVEAAQIAEARKKAYDTALAEAKALASLTNHTLGKLAAIKASMTNEAASTSFFAQLEDVTSNFAAQKNEILSPDPQSLSLDCIIELRFEIGKP